MTNFAMLEDIQFPRENLQSAIQLEHRKCRKKNRYDKKIHC